MRGAGQTLQLVEPSAPLVEEPTAHGTQASKRTVEPLFEVPLAQGLQSRDEASKNVPAAQAAQELSLVAPGALVEVPLGQAMHGMPRRE